MVCSCPLGVQALGFPGWYKPSSAPTRVLPRATLHDLQSNLQMAPACVGLGGSQAKPSCEPRLADASARPGAISKRPGDWLRLAVA